MARACGALALGPLPAPGEDPVMAVWFVDAEMYPLLAEALADLLGRPAYEIITGREAAERISRDTAAASVVAGGPGR